MMCLRAGGRSPSRILVAAACLACALRAAPARADWYRIYDAKLRPKSYDGGPFHNKVPWGISAQFGGGLMSQIVARDVNDQPKKPTLQSSVRGSLGFWLYNFEVEVLHRRQVFDFTAAGFQPRWTSYTFGLDFQGPKLFWGWVTPFVFLLGGYETYANNVTGADSRFIQAFDAPTFGFRLRFVLGQSWETGGDLRYSSESGITKFFVQGDIRWWFEKGEALGAGYWVDTYHRSDIDFRETVLALEMYMRFIF